MFRLGIRRIRVKYLNLYSINLSANVKVERKRGGSLKMMMNVEDECFVVEMNVSRLKKNGYLE